MTYIQTNNLDTSKEYSSITIGLASPESILARSYGEILKPETINTDLISLKKTVCFAKRYSDLLKIMNVIVGSIKVYGIAG